MFDIQSGIRMVASAASVIAFGFTVAGEIPGVPAERESRIFSSGPVRAQPQVAPATRRPPIQPLDIPPALEQPTRYTTMVQVAEPVVAESTFIAAPTMESTAVPSTVPTAEVMDQYYTPAYSAPVYYQNQNLPHYWFSAESLIWWTSQPDVPVIATTSAQGTPGLQAGILGQPQTGEIWGGGDLFDVARGGVRLRAGKWSDDNDGRGIHAEFLMLGSAGHNFLGSSNGSPILARPFFNEQTGVQDAQLIAFPGLATGSLRFNAETRMYSVGMNYWAELVAEYDDECGEPKCGESQCAKPRCGSTCNCNQTDSVLGIKIGPRFIHHDDTILADETLTGLASGNRFHILDSFKTENSFLGGEIGLRGQRNQGIFSMDLGLNLGIGATRQELDVSGLTTITTPAGLRTTTPGGFLAQATNSGSWDKTKFSLVPSLEFKLGMEAGNGWRFGVGYDVMYWTNVLRASEQIDTVIHPDQFPTAINPTTATRPGVLLNESDYFAHGISVSIERRW